MNQLVLKVIYLISRLTENSLKDTTYPDAIKTLEQINHLSQMLYYAIQSEEENSLENSIQGFLLSQPVDERMAFETYFFEEDLHSVIERARLRAVNS